MDFKNFKEMFGNSRIKELEKQLAKNNPILEEAANYIDALEAKVAELQSSHDALEAKLAKYQNLEPVAWHHPVEGLSYENHYTGNIPLYALEK